MKKICLFIRTLLLVLAVVLISSKTARAQYFLTCGNTFSTANTASYTSFVFQPDAGHVIRIDGLNAGFNVVAPDVLVIDGIGYNNTNPPPATITATRSDGLISVSFTDNTSALNPFWTSTISCICDPYAVPPYITYAPNVICTDKTLTAADFTISGGVVDGYGYPSPPYIYEFQYRYPSSPSWIPGLPSPPLLVQPIIVMTRLKRNDVAGCVSPWSGDRTISVTTIPQGSLTGNTICSGGTGQFTYTSTSGTSTSTLVINGQTYTGVVSGTPFNANPNPTSTTEYTLTSITSSGGCVRTTDITGATATINVLNQWTGTAGSDWNASGNWSCGLPPNSLSDVIIPNLPPFPVISPTTQADCRNLEIQSGATLTIESDGLSSGSLIVSGSSTGLVTYNRQLRTEANFGDRHFFSAPVGGLGVSEFITANSGKINLVGPDYQIREWSELGGIWPITSAGDFVIGRGYSVNQATGSDGMLIFTGSLVNSASITATSPYKEGYTDRSTPEAYGVNNTEADIWAPDRSWILYGGGGWNLVGNPFTSAMNAAAFIEANSTPLTKFDPNYQALYVYNGITGQYEYAAAEVPGPIYQESGFFSDNVQAGQGFFVLALYNNVVFNFTSAMQVHNADLTLLKSTKTEEPWPGLQLKVRYGSKESLTTIVYHGEMTTGVDPGYDVGQMSSRPDVEIYTSLVVKDNSVNFARQALPLTQCDKIIVPVGIDSEKGGEVTFSASIVPPGDYKFYLEDRLTGNVTDLETGTYTATLPSKTYGTGRFYIKAASTITGIETLPEDINVKNLRVWTSSDKLIIKGEISSKAVCVLYTLGGQKIVESRLKGGDLNTITIPATVNGVYLVKISDQGMISTHKVVFWTR